MSLSHSLEFSAFPEEILDRVLSHCVISSLYPPPRPMWHQAKSPSSSSDLPVRGRMAVLLVSKLFFRISTPFFYHTLHILSSTQLHRLLVNALRPNPFLAKHVRRIIFSGIWAEGGELLHLANNAVRLLDLTLDSTQLSPGVHGYFVRDYDAEEFCDGLKELRSLTHLAIRKPSSVYLTQEKPKYVLSHIANAMNDWDDLEHADLNFRLSDDSGTLLLAQNSLDARGARNYLGPITLLTQSLSTRPNLRTFSTLLPSVWNETILRVSSNPSLERIILGDGRFTSKEPTHSRGMSWSGDSFYGPSLNVSPQSPSYESYFEGRSTGLFLLQTKKHERLDELIKAGTSLMRSRAQSMCTPPPCLPEQVNPRSATCQRQHSLLVSSPHSKGNLSHRSEACDPMSKYQSSQGRSRETLSSSYHVSGSRVLR